MTNFHLLKQSEKKPGELDIWSAILPFAFDLICGILLIVLGILVICISGPSMFLAWQKLRKRNLGPVLNANGWAINSVILVNIVFGATLTSVAKYPKVRTKDPYAKKKTPLWLCIFDFLLVAALVACAWWFFCK